MSIPNTPIWTEFFKKLEELPELWNMKLEVFKDRHKKEKAWLKLLEIYRTIEPNANLDTLKKRVSNIKTCYRRELRKVRQREQSGMEPDYEYVPNLWYFELLDFLRDEENQIPGISAVYIEEESLQESPLPTIAESCSLKRKKGIVEHLSDRNDLLKKVMRQLVRNDNRDEASIYAESWATSFRNLSAIQKIYAKKAIEDILILGQLNELNFHSVNTHFFASSPHASSTPGSPQVPSIQTSRSFTP